MANHFPDSRLMHCIFTFCALIHNHVHRPLPVVAPVRADVRHIVVVAHRARRVDAGVVAGSCTPGDRRTQLLLDFEHQTCYENISSFIHKFNAFKYQFK